MRRLINRQMKECMVGTKQFCFELRIGDTKLKHSQKFNYLGNVNFGDIIRMKGLLNLTPTEHTD